MRWVAGWGDGLERVGAVSGVFGYMTGKNVFDITLLIFTAVWNFLAINVWIFWFQLCTKLFFF